MKIGRNEPCPCGSGKKYKRCCVDRPQGPRAPSASSNAAVAKQLAARSIDMHPYTVAKISENPDSAGNNAELRRAIERNLLTHSTIARVAAMDTDAIKRQLARHGVRYSDERFRTLAAERWSAWDVAEEWLARDPVTCHGKDEDFVGLAACELWKRLLPDRPSMEMLDDWMQEGYEMLQHGRQVDACAVWWKVWRTLHPRFAADMTTMDGTDSLFRGVQSVFNWSQDFEMELTNAGRKDPEWARRGARYCREWIAQFVDEDELMQVNFRRALADLLILEGDVSAGEATMHEIVQRWPKNAWGYVALADFHAGWFPRGKKPHVDLSLAIEWLERGAASVRKGDPDHQVLRDRMEELRRRADRS